VINYHLFIFIFRSGLHILIDRLLKFLLLFHRVLYLFDFVSGSGALILERNAFCGNIPIYSLLISLAFKATLAMMKLITTCWSSMIFSKNLRCS